MKIDIVVVYIPRYAKGHEKHFVPPITGIYLAALVPEHHTVRVIHQQVEPVDLETDADLVALSFFTGFAPEAYRLAKEFKKRGKKVIAGGPHVTFSPEESLEHFDSIVIGEAESVFPQLIQDAENNTLQRKYTGEHKELAGLPCPRYEFVKQNFFVTRVVQATRGCPFSCTFCSVSSLNPGYRTRPVKDVIRDISYNDFRHWWQRKIVWFWDDNLTAHRPYIKELLQSMIPLRKWWLTQASMDIARDEELLDLLQKSGCIGIFFGIESFQSDSLKDAGKPQNKREEYKKQIQALHSKGICVMGGFISGFDSDTPESIQAMAKELYDIGVDVPFLSVLTPYKGTDIYDKLLSEGRIREPKGWEFYNGYNVSFVPQKMTTQELLSAHRTLWKKAFSIPFSMKRILRSLFALRTGAWLMCLFMNVFYGIKAFRENLPKSFEENNPYSQK